MPIHIIGLNPLRTFELNPVTAPSVADLLSDVEAYIHSIPASERYNLYYTLSDVSNPVTRAFVKAQTFGFDVDIFTSPVAALQSPDSASPAGPTPRAQPSEDECRVLAAIAIEALNLDADCTAVVATGHGIQLIIQLDSPWTTTDFYQFNKPWYLKACTTLRHAYTSRGYSIQADQVFDSARLFRLPGTINRKKDLPDVSATALQPNLLPQSIPGITVDCTPRVQSPEALSSDSWKDYIPTNSQKALFASVDAAHVMSECAFLVHASKNPNSLSEPEWYAALGITAWLPDGERLSHDISRGHNSYTHKETDRKIAQVRKLTGARTCRSVSQLWSGCQSCPHWQKINSPISIKSDDFIKSMSTGFFLSIPTKSGRINYVPDHEGLTDHYISTHGKFVTISDRIFYVFNGKYFEEREAEGLEVFASENMFKSKDNPIFDKDRVEFRKYFMTKNRVSTQWFKDTTVGHINFKNGILRLSDFVLLDHDSSMGFRYCLPYNYDSSATAPQFESFLKQISCDRQDIVQILLEAGGYCLSNDPPWLAKAIILVGDGANGKSTFKDILCEVAGHGAYSVVDLQDLSKDTYRIHLEGKLFNVSAEASPDSLGSSQEFKKISTGEEVVVRHMYHSSYSTIINAKLLALCNETPKSHDKTLGLIRRMLIVPFDAVFDGDKKDPFIKLKLMNELPGIFNCFTNAYKKVKQQKHFSYSESIDKALEQYRSDNDNVGEWFYDSVLVFKKEEVNYNLSIFPKTELYQHYREWCHTVGTSAANAKNFWIRLRRFIPDFDDREYREYAQGNKHGPRKLRGVALQKYD